MSGITGEVEADPKQTLTRVVLARVARSWFTRLERVMKAVEYVGGSADFFVLVFTWGICHGHVFSRSIDWPSYSSHRPIGMALANIMEPNSFCLPRRLVSCFYIIWLRRDAYRTFFYFFAFIGHPILKKYYRSKGWKEVPTQLLGAAKLRATRLGTLTAEDLK